MYVEKIDKKLAETAFTYFKINTLVDFVVISISFF